jgi:hypothetical protein
MRFRFIMPPSWDGNFRLPLASFKRGMSWAAQEMVLLSGD